MLSLSRSQILPQLTRQCQLLSRATLTTQASASSTSTPTPSSSSPPSSRSDAPYFIPRNTRNNLPVYSDIRNAGGRFLVHIRNVEGNIATLSKDISETLFPKDSHEASKMKVQINQGKHITISGGPWRTEVASWLQQKGF